MRSGVSDFSAAASRLRRASGSKLLELFVFDMDGAVGAFGQRFADGLRGARRPGAKRDHFAAVLFLQLQACFERVGVGLVDLVR